MLTGPVDESTTYTHAAGALAAKIGQNEGGYRRSWAKDNADISWTEDSTLDLTGGVAGRLHDERPTVAITGAFGASKD